MAYAAGSGQLQTLHHPHDNVVVELDAGLDEDVRLARSVAERFGPITARYFKVTQFASLTFPTDEALSAIRQAPNTAG